MIHTRSSICPVNPSYISTPIRPTSNGQLKQEQPTSPIYTLGDMEFEEAVESQPGPIMINPLIRRSFLVQHQALGPYGGSSIRLWHSRRPWKTPCKMHRMLPTPSAYQFVARYIHPYLGTDKYSSSKILEGKKFIDMSLEKKEQKRNVCWFVNNHIHQATRMQPVIDRSVINQRTSRRLAQTDPSIHLHNPFPFFVRLFLLWFPFFRRTGRVGRPSVQRFGMIVVKQAANRDVHTHTVHGYNSTGKANQT